ncbi:MAG: hypothetical protein ACK583_07595 [Cyanobacteriota bacterium]
MPSRQQAEGSFLILAALAALAALSGPAALSSQPCSARSSSLGMLRAMINPAERR